MGMIEVTYTKTTTERFHLILLDFWICGQQVCIRLPLGVPEASAEYIKKTAEKKLEGLADPDCSFTIPGDG